MNEHVAASCRMLTVSEATVLKVVKTQRKQAFEQKKPGYEKGMRKCPNCDQLGLFVHDGNLAKCVNPEHENICAVINKKAQEEAEAAERNRTKPRQRKCTTCACSGMFKPDEFKLAANVENLPESEFKSPKRCSRHVCLAVDKMEITPGAQCDGCMQVFCTRCYRCKCYRSAYSTRRCDSCVNAHATWDPESPMKCPPLYPLTEAFTATKEKLTICNICRAKRQCRTILVCTSCVLLTQHDNLHTSHYITPHRQSNADVKVDRLQRHI